VYDQGIHELLSDVVLTEWDNSSRICKWTRSCHQLQTSATPRLATTKEDAYDSADVQISGQHSLNRLRPPEPTFCRRSFGQFSISGLAPKLNLPPIRRHSGGSAVFASSRRPFRLLRSCSAVSATRSQRKFPTPWRTLQTFLQDRSPTWPSETNAIEADWICWRRY